MDTELLPLLVFIIKKMHPQKRLRITSEKKKDLKND